MRLFKSNFMEPNSIPLVSDEPLLRDKVSAKSIIAIEYQAYLSQTPFQHGRNTGEVKLFLKDQYKKVDGYHEPSKTVVEFHGCYWHGCPNCFPNRTKTNSHNKKTFEELYKNTQKHDQAIRDAGYNLQTIWECQFDRIFKNDPQFINWYNHPKVKPIFDKLIGGLSPRKAFFGGRTDSLRLHHKINSNEKIGYFDFTSLYPYINKHGWYPDCHPTIIKHPPSTDISNYQGVIYCDVLPPKHLLHPVLPAHINNKLNFVLCQACATSQSSASCSHLPHQRQLRGSWTHQELNRALQLGYIITQIHEVHHFEKGRTGLFNSYVNTFLKIKQEASGWPKGCDTPEEKQQFIQTYAQREGVILNPDNMIKNEGRRATAKICLNSLWGKFGQRPDQAQTIYINTADEWYRLRLDNTIQILDYSIINEEEEDMLFVTYKNKSIVGNIENDSVNIYIAIFTTSQARLKLHEVLHTLQERVLYCDTDSVFFTYDDQNPPPFETGDYLGLLKDELSGHHITEFITLGPKNYAYRTDDGKTVCKIKGFTLNYENSNHLNFESMIEMLHKKNQDPTSAPSIELTNQFHITADKSHNLRTEYQTKVYNFECDKRVINWVTLQTYPYGYF
jgi:hypothetical protein